MSRGKYSPKCPNTGLKNSKELFTYNCYGEIPPEYNYPEDKEIYDERVFLDGYDEDGYDSYGYSAFDNDGNYVGVGNGVDRDGYSEMDYLTLKDIPEEHRDSYYFYNS